MAVAESRPASGAPSPADRSGEAPATAMRGVSVSVPNFIKCVERVVAVDDVTLEIAAGEFWISQ